MKTFGAAIAFIAVFLFTSLAGAQETTQTQPPTDPNRIGALIDILKDDTLRQQLIGDLERVQQEQAQNPDQPAEAPPAEAETPQEAGEQLIGGGLVTGLSTWLGDLGERLPTAALGAPIDVKIEQAGNQVERRLAQPGAAESFRSFMLWSLLGWFAITALTALVFLWGRRRIRTAIRRDTAKKALYREAAIRALLGILPLISSVIVSVIWIRLSPYSAAAGSLFVLLSIPFAIGMATWGIVSALLVFLAPSKGWKIVSFAQRRLSPLVAILIGIATLGGIVVTPEMRAAIGPATSDIVSFILDIAVPLFALYIILTHKRTVRALIVRGHSANDASVFSRAIYWTGMHWQHFGFAFVVLNIGARIFGAESGDFLTQSTFSVLVIVAAFVLTASIHRYETHRKTLAKRRYRVGVRSEIFRQLSSILYRVLQVAIVLFAFSFCLALWGLSIGTWLTTEAGLLVVGPVMSIVMVMLVAWTLWVALDAWITATLSQSAADGGFRQSARVRTLLPLLRNVAFVVLSVLTVIGVLSNLGINVAPLIAGAGVVGLAVGFGSQQLVQDVITGLFILLEDTLAIGDTIDTGDRVGTVEALTIRTVKIRDGDGALHTIPFSTVKALKNSSRGYGVYTVTVTLDPSADVEKAIEIMKDVGEEVRREPRFAHNILIPLDIWGVDKVSPEGLVIKGAIRTRPLQQWGVGREINRRINARLHEMEIPLATRALAPV